MVKLCFPCGHDYMGSNSSTPEKGKEHRTATGACGIDCTVCRLHVTGVCSSCGPGHSTAGKEKLAAQRRLFGQGCPMLECAVDRNIGHCLRDCEEFPCERFSTGPYPYSQGFLEMQQRRREEAGSLPAAAWPETAGRIWEQLRDRNPEDVCRSAMAFLDPDGKYLLKCLNETWLIDIENRSVIKTDGEFGGEWDRQMPFLILVYLAFAQEGSLSNDFVAPRDLMYGTDLFRGRYELDTSDLIRVYDQNGQALVDAAHRLGGIEIKGGDAAIRLRVFPKFVLDYILWIGDEEFPANFTILLDRKIPDHYPVDATGVLMNLVSRRLLLADRYEAD